MAGVVVVKPGEAYVFADRKGAWMAGTFGSLHALNGCLVQHWGGEGSAVGVEVVGDLGRSHVRHD